MSYLIDTIEHLSVLLSGDSLSDKEREKLNDLTEEQLEEKINDLKLLLHGL